MAGIMDIGVHLPWRRLSGKAVAEAWGGPSGGERTVAGPDEDSLTMAVSAVLDCLGDRERGEVGALFFASSSSPYLEKSASSIIAAASDLPRDIRAQDMTGSLRSGTGALLLALDGIRAGSFGQALVASADARLSAPGSALEMAFGDAGATVLVGSGEEAASVVTARSTSQELLDSWRTDRQKTVMTGDARFNRVEAYQKCLVETCQALLKGADLKASALKWAVLTSPDGRGHAGAARALGLDPKAVADPQTEKLGMLGNPQPFVTLAGVLEASAPGDRVLLACYGDGCDALVLEVGRGIEAFKKRRRLRRASAPVKSYARFLAYRGMLSECGDEFRPFSSQIQAGREAPLNVRFRGKKCQECGTVNTLNLRVCPHCGSRDHFDAVPLRKRGKLNTYTQEHYYPTLDPPVTMAVVDLECGARFLCQMTDADASEVKVGMEVEMTFRRLHEGGGYHNYCWKCRPAREVPP